MRFSYTKYSSVIALVCYAVVIVLAFPIRFSGYNRPETLTNFPALVVLGSQISNFNYNTFLSANGYDLRFADEATGTSLNYEIESWQHPILTGDRCTNGTVSASAEKGGGEAKEMAFDNLTGTKWYTQTSNPSAWIQYRFPNNDRWTIKSYTVSSANDVPGRDPKEWIFQGSNDGVEWTNVDSRTNQSFPSRYQTRQFMCLSNTNAYEFYRLNIVTNSGAADGIQLSEIQMFGYSENVSYVWVQLPALTSNCCIWAFWGNSDNTNQLPCTTNGSVWSPQCRAVWHLTDCSDSSTGKINGVNYGSTDVPGVIAGGRGFEGATYIECSNANLNITGSLTISSWLYHETGIGWSFAYASGGSGNWSYNYGVANTTNWATEIQIPTYRLIQGPSAADEKQQWHNIVFTYDYSSGTDCLYHDGILSTNANDAGPVRSADSFRIGSKYDSSCKWNGKIDELRVYTNANSSNWIWACYMNQASNGAFQSFGQIERAPLGMIISIR